MSAYTVDDFKADIAAIQEKPNYRKPIGFAIGRVHRGQLNRDKILTCDFPVINWNENFGSAAVFMNAAGLLERDDWQDKNSVIVDLTPNMVSDMMRMFSPYVKDAAGDAHRNVQVVRELSDMAKKRHGLDNNYQLVMIFEDTKVDSPQVAYLKLGAISARKVAPPKGLVTDGIFGALENVAWSGRKAYEIDWLQQNEIRLKFSEQYPVIDYVDKFPRYFMQAMPEMRTRILDGGKVRFGAHIAEGTTLMPGASYINFNAGTIADPDDEEPAAFMIEGRISSSATVGHRTDVGGGASILGTLSGGNETPISVGKRCLLGANSVTGIPLGDGCVVDAGIAVLAGTKFNIAAGEQAKIAEVNPQSAFAGAVGAERTFKGSELAHLNGVHYRQNSETGAMIAQRSRRKITLNEALHASTTPGKGPA